MTDKIHEIRSLHNSIKTHNERLEELELGENVPQIQKDYVRDIGYLLTELDAANNLIKQLIVERKSIESFESDIAGFRIQLDAAKQDIERLLGANDALSQNREKWRVSHMKLEQENESLRESLVEWQGDFKSLKQENERLNMRLKRLKEGVTEFQINTFRPDSHEYWELNDLIREEANPHTAPASGSADSVGTK